MVRVGLGRTDFLWIFIFEPPDFFGFSRLICPQFFGKSVKKNLQENPRQNLYSKNSQRTSAEGSGPTMILFCFSLNVSGVLGPVGPLALHTSGEVGALAVLDRASTPEMQPQVNMTRAMVVWAGLVDGSLLMSWGEGHISIFSRPPPPPIKTAHMA